MTKAQRQYGKIAAYVNYEFKDDKATKAKIARHYRKLAPHLSRPTATFKSKSKKRIGEAAKIAGLGRIGKSLKAVPVDNPGNVANMKIKYDSGSLVYETPETEARGILFSKAKAKKIFKKAIKKNRKTKEYTIDGDALTEWLEEELADVDDDEMIQIDTRGFLLGSESIKPEAIKQMIRLITKYPEAAQQFLNGVRATKLKNQRKTKRKTKAKGKGGNRGQTVGSNRRGNRPVQKGKGSKAVSVGSVRRKRVSRISKDTRAAKPSPRSKNRGIRAQRRKV